MLENQGGARNSGERTSKYEEVTLRNGSGRKFCRVLFSYEPCNDDELKLVPDEAIEYLGEVEEGWWRGRVKGRTGVFPSNFVSPPSPEEVERNKENSSKKELCRVLFPYEAANEDELTLVEGDIIMLVSKDAPDKGWWKGELKGQIGLFPDNFVDVIPMVKDDQQQHQDPTAAKSSAMKHQTGKRKETAGVRKSLDTRNNAAGMTVAAVAAAGGTKFTSSTSASSLTTTSSGASEKKPSSALMSSLKRLVGENSNSSNNGNGSVGTGLGEELDEVERGEGAPLSHLTASRAKAPRRRLPSTQHLRHLNAPSSPPSGGNNAAPMIMVRFMIEELFSKCYLHIFSIHQKPGHIPKVP